MINEIKEKILDEIRYGELNNDNGLLPTWLNKPEILHHAEYMKCFQDGVSCKRYTDAVIVKNIFKEFEKADVPDTNAGEWTPCSLMLPKKHEHVLVTWKCGEYYHTTEAVYEDNGWLHYCPKPLPSDIEFIAWMPLPEPYKEDANGEND